MRVEKLIGTIHHYQKTKVVITLKIFKLCLYILNIYFM